MIWPLLLHRRNILLMLVLLTSVQLIAPGCQRKSDNAPAPAPLEVKVVAAEQRDVPISREWVGQTFGAVDIEIRARVDGWLQGLHFREGSEVRKGTLLYTIDQNELQQRVAEAQGKVAEARTRAVRAAADVRRYQPLAAAGAVSQRELEIAEAEYEASQAEVEAAQAGLKLAEIDLGYATIHAPIDGLIGISSARVGDYVGRPPNVVILNTISRVDSIRIRFSITEQEYLDLMRRLQASPERGSRTPIELDLVLGDGTMHPYKGHVLFTERRVDPSTGTLLVEASFPNPEKVVRPGQFARVRTVFERRRNAVVVPARALFEIQGQSVLYAVGVDGKVQFRRIQAGPRVGQLQVIEQGVAAGDKVVVEGIQRLRPDMIVTAATIPFPSESAPEEGNAPAGH